VAPALLWWYCGETFFCETDRVPADILVVESWAGTEALRAAAAEFQTGHYRMLVTTGGYSDDRWSMRKVSFAAMARNDLLSFGIPGEQILLASTGDEHRQRTHASAVATWQRLVQLGASGDINVFTYGPHARRSRLTFAKAAPTGRKVGVIAFVPREFSQEPWWQSSERGEDLIKETVAYGYELLLNGGRFGEHENGSPRAVVLGSPKPNLLQP
jgi:hypothetical protein